MLFCIIFMCTVHLICSILNKADLLHLNIHHYTHDTERREQIKAKKKKIYIYIYIHFTSQTAVLFTVSLLLLYHCCPTTAQRQSRLPGTRLFLSACSGSTCSDRLKMPLLLFALLLAAGVLLSSAEAQSSFSKLPDSYKHGVELAETNVNAHEGVQHHFLFFKTIQKSQIDAGFDVVYIYHNIYLKATKCKKGTENVDTTTCAFRNDRPLIDCAICYKTYAGAIEEEPKPYVSCVHKPALTQDMKKDRIEHCNKMGYISGSPTLLAVIS
uniref:Retinoic acid receptor responder protein 2 n=1 Tax=Sinocyclocheilus rhinocerous TaxID=307959 RepID=A0A673GSU1_9TELE